MSIEHQLTEIERRAESHHLAAGGGEIEGDPYFSASNWEDKPHRLVYDLATDVRLLSTALRKVLEAVDHGERTTVNPDFAWVHPSEVRQAVTDSLRRVP